MNKRRLGDIEEIRAVEFLETNGYEILERNFRCRLGEIDIVARDDGYLVFVEVKYRSSLTYGSPAEAIGINKQRKIYRVAEYYVLKNNIASTTPMRFDTVLITGDEVSVIKNAFGAM